MKYFDGPSGVYYQQKSNELILLLDTGVKICDKKFRFVGRCYDLFSRELKISKTVIKKSKTLLWIGEL